MHGNVDPNGSETTFWFEYGTSQNLGSVTAFQSAGANDSSLAVVISVSNLQPLTKYYFRLNAQNQFGTVNGQILNFTTKGPSQASAPTVKTSAVSNITDDSAQLHGNINPNGAATTYWFEYSDDSLLSNVRVFSTPQQSLNDGSSPANVLVDINNLRKDTKYTVILTARNQYGTVRGEMVTFTTKK